MLLPLLTLLQLLMAVHPSSFPKKVEIQEVPLVIEMLTLPWFYIHRHHRLVLVHPSP